MAALSSSALWLGHAQAESLLRFNLLPSLWLHASRERSLLPAGLAQAFEQSGATGGLHRHWSAALIRGLGLAPATQLEDPALPLALLPAESFERLLSWCGLVLLGPRIRQTIARDEVRLLEEQLGDDALRFARTRAAALHASGDGPRLEHANVSAQASLWGSALLAAAFDAAGEPVARRGLLRLPEDAANERFRLPASLSQSRQALALARAVLDVQDPEWLSSFPASR
jgi:hypothetical protein